MATYTFKDEQGQPFNITAPEGKSRADTAQWLNDQYQTAEGVQRVKDAVRRHTQSQRPAMARLGAAVAEPIVRAGTGIRELVTPMLPKDIRESEEEVTAKLKGDVERLRGYAGEGALATSGRMVGTLGTLAGPARAGLGLTRAAGKAAPVLTQGATRGWAAPLAGESAGMAAFTGAATPGGPQERLGAAGGEFTTGMAGGTIGRVLEKAIRGIRTSPAGERMLDQGVELTPGQASAGRAWPFVESRMTYVPGLAGPTSKLETKGLRSWNQRLLQKAVQQAEGADPARVTAGGKTGVDEARAELGRAYDRLYGSFAEPDTLVRLGDQATDVQARVMQGADASLAGTDINRVQKFIQKHTDELRKNASPQAVQRYTAKLKQARDAAKGKLDFEEAELFDDALNRWKGALDQTAPGFGEQLRRLDRSYAMTETFADAAGKAKARQEGFFTPAQLTASAKTKGKLLDPEIADANETIRDMVGRENIFGQLMVGGGGLGILGMADPATAAATAGSALALGRTAITEPVRRSILGRTDWQQAGQRALGQGDRRAQMLRSAFARSAAAAPEEY